MSLLSDYQICNFHNGEPGKRVAYFFIQHFFSPFSFFSERKTKSTANFRKNTTKHLKNLTYDRRKDTDFALYSGQCPVNNSRISFDFFDGIYLANVRDFILYKRHDYLYRVKNFINILI